MGLVSFIDNWIEQHERKQRRKIETQRQCDREMILHERETIALEKIAQALQKENK